MNIAALSIASALLAGHVAPAKGPVKSQSLFNKMKFMQGGWHGESKSGMKEDLDIKLIAGDAVLMETSNLGMVTMYHLDGERLLLTHYCMAKNQPRLLASEASDDGKTVTFTFLDGTNMKSRNVGHMDKVVFEFIDKDTYRSKWTWYQDGKERWMEDFTYRRIKPASPPKAAR
ncbi:MAG TPA: hypothetical protein VG944_01915 [Fimbriimonas sp.]|nr:hypothetical protein [Fimbriimonas sp.]